MTNLQSFHIKFDSIFPYEQEILELLQMCPNLLWQEIESKFKHQDLSHLTMMNLPHFIFNNPST